MIAKITLENFFSFGKKTEILLNPDINVLVGINGSGKSNLLKAIKLLYEGVAGEGFEKLFLRDWGGFDAITNLGSKKDEIKLEFEFNTKKLDRANNIKTNTDKILIYTIIIYRSGTTSYYLVQQKPNKWQLLGPQWKPFESPFIRFCHCIIEIINKL